MMMMCVPNSLVVVVVVTAHRRRMMIAGATPMAYSSTLECTLTIWREEGLAGFFRGAMANIARALISALLLSCYDAFVVPALAPALPPSNAN
jgi:hypothetical protein